MARTLEKRHFYHPHFLWAQKIQEKLIIADKQTNYHSNVTATFPKFWDKRPKQPLRWLYEPPKNDIECTYVDVLLENLNNI